MIKVVKGNVVLRVDDSLMDHYVEKGYTAKTLDGRILKEAIPTDVSSLRKAYLQSKEEIASLKAEIEQLKSQLDKSQQPIVFEDRPKRQRKKLSDEE